MNKQEQFEHIKDQSVHPERLSNLLWRLLWKEWKQKPYDGCPGRKADNRPTVCTKCGWMNKLKNANNTWQSDWEHECVDPVDHCPKCKTDTLITAI